MTSRFALAARISVVRPISGRAHDGTGTALAVGRITRGAHQRLAACARAVRNDDAGGAEIEHALDQPRLDVGHAHQRRNLGRISRIDRRVKITCNPPSVFLRRAFGRFWQAIRQLSRISLRSAPADLLSGTGTFVSRRVRHTPGSLSHDRERMSLDGGCVFAIGTSHRKDDVAKNRSDRIIPALRRVSRERAPDARSCLAGVRKHHPSCSASGCTIVYGSFVGIGQ